MLREIVLFYPEVTIILCVEMIKSCKSSQHTEPSPVLEKCAGNCRIRHYYVDFGAKSPPSIAIPFATSLLTCKSVPSPKLDDRKISTCSADI